MDLWHRARSLAEEAATKTHELTLEAAKRSHDFTIGSSKFSDIVSDAAKRSKEIAAEASKKSKEIAAEASKKSREIAAEASDLIKSRIPSATSEAVETDTEEKDLERFGVTDELREFVKGITVNTFRDFPLQDDSEVSDIPTVSNVRQDLTAWQEKHAKIVLSTVKEISKLRYELCPRVMKERKFWRIYFILVNSHVAPYEERYTEEAKQKPAEEVKENNITESSSSGTLSTPEAAVVNQQSKSSSGNEQDLDVFLLGDLGDSDEGPDVADRDFEDDLDKI